jgi:hypothetical protein
MPTGPGSENLSLRSGLEWLDNSVSVPADRRVLLAAAAVAIATDIAARAGGVGLGGALLVAVVAGAVLAIRPPAGLHARLLVAGTPLFGLWLFLRTSPWLLLPDLVVVGGLLVLGVSLGRRSLLDLSIPAASAHAVRALGHGVAGPTYVVAAAQTIRPPADPAMRVRARAMARGVLLAAPLLLVLGVLLASADVVFASAFQVDIDPPSALAHVIAILAGAWAMGGLLRAAAGSPMGQLPAPPRLGWVECAVVLGLMNALFLGFAVAQVVALSEGGRRVIETAGLTYAQYARTGFFQLLGVAAITLAIVLSLRAVVDQTDRSVRRRFVMLAEVTVVLTLVIVFVSIRRLGLYADAFGLTMLRLYSTVFAYWIGVVFILLGLLLAGLGLRRAWLPSVAVAIGLAGLLWLNVANPEAIVVRHNVDFAARTGRFDPAYASDLSDDAIPTLVAALPDLDAASRGLVLQRLCPPHPTARTGWASSNVARDRAVESLAAACAGRP